MTRQQILVLVTVVLSTAVAVADVVLVSNDFDIPTQGDQSPFTIHDTAGEDAFIADKTNDYLMVVRDEPSTNTVQYIQFDDALAMDSSSVVRVSFDFRLYHENFGKFGNGFSFALLNTDPFSNGHPAERWTTDGLTVRHQTDANNVNPKHDVVLFWKSTMVTNVSEGEHGIEFGDISSYNNPDPANADNPGGIPFHSALLEVDFVQKLVSYGIDGTNNIFISTVDALTPTNFFLVFGAQSETAPRAKHHFHLDNINVIQIIPPPQGTVITVL